MLFVLYLRTRSRMVAASFALLACVALFSSEIQIVIFVALYAYVLGVHRTHEGRIDIQAAAFLTIVVAFSVMMYAGIRLFLVPSTYDNVRTNLPGLTMMFHAAVMEIAAILCPLDPVLGNALGLPLPNDGNFRTVVPIIAVLTLLVSGALGTLFWKALRTRWHGPRRRWARELFLGITAFLPLCMTIVLRAHASESYLYATIPLFILLLSTLGFEVSEAARKPTGGRIYAATVATLAIVFGAATYVRNERVVTCGATAHRILSAVPFSRFETDGKLLFTDFTDPDHPRHYGLYGFSGLNTIRSYPWYTLTYALQVASGNTKIADAVDDRRAGRAYTAHFLVQSDGRVYQTP